MELTVDNILKEIGADFISLVQVPEDGYWYFIYNDGLYIRTQTVNVKNLEDLEFRMWVYMGKDFNEMVVEDAIEFESHKDDWKWENIAANH